MRALVASSITGRFAGVGAAGLVAATGVGLGAGFGASTTGAALTGAGAADGSMRRAMRNPIATQKATVMNNEVFFMAHFRQPWTPLANV